MFAVAGAVGVVLMAVSWRFGYVGDEPYFLAAGRYHLGEVRGVSAIRLDAPEPNVNQGVPIWLCPDSRAPWPRLWQQMHRW